MTKSDLLLHIGAHKTGTTTIQHALFANRDKLAAQGISYVTAGGRPQVHRLLGRVAPDSMEGGHRLAQPDELGRLIDAAATDRVILSSENFSFFFREAEIKLLAKHLHGRFRRVRVLTYLRRQDAHAVSHHQEGSKPHRVAEQYVFGNGLAPLPDHPTMDRYLDYNRRIGRWMNVFGDENVSVRVFEPDRLVAGDAWADFLSAADIDPGDMAPAVQRNQSVGLTKARIGHLMNARNMDADVHRLVTSMLPDDPRLSPARSEAIAFYDRYRAGNIALNAKLGATDGSDLFGQDFSHYPEKANADWSQDAATAAVGSLLDVIGKLTEATTAETLRDTALMAEAEGDKALALALMEAAAVQRPNGKFIRQKLAELRAAAAAKSARGQGRSR